MKFEVELEGDAITALKDGVDSELFLHTELRKIIDNGLQKMHDKRSDTPHRNRPNIHEVKVSRI